MQWARKTEPGGDLGGGVARERKDREPWPATCTAEKPRAWRMKTFRVGRKPQPFSPDLVAVIFRKFHGTLRTHLV